VDVGSSDTEVLKFARTHAANFGNGLTILAPVIERACYVHDDATDEELRARGVTIVTEPFELLAISRRLAFFCDPFGNLIELAEVLP